MLKGKVGSAQVDPPIALERCFNSIKNEHGKDSDLLVIESTREKQLVHKNFVPSWSFEVSLDKEDFKITLSNGIVKSKYCEWVHPKYQGYVICVILEENWQCVGQTNSCGLFKLPRCTECNVVMENWMETRCSKCIIEARISSNKFLVGNSQ